MERPKVILMVSASLDGRIAYMPGTTMYSPVDESLHPFDILSDDWNYFKDKIESIHNPDFLLEGSNMLVTESEDLKALPEYDGNPDILYSDYLPQHIVNREGRTKWTSLVDGRGRFREAYKAYTHDPASYIIHLTSHAAPPEYLGFLQKEEIPYLITGNERVDLKDAFRKLYSKLGVKCIMTTSGGKLSGALIRENLLDEVNILFSPVVFGGTNAPVLFKSPDINPPDILPRKLKYIESQVLESGAIWVRYEVIH